MITISHVTKVNVMDKNNPAVSKCKSGDTIVFEVLDCFANQIRSEEQGKSGIDWDNINPATGPLYIEEAKVGDILKVEILDIEIGDQGVMTDGPGSGVMGDYIKEGIAKILKIENGKIFFNDKLSFDIDPMIGVIGVAPEGEGISTGTPGAHGSNMDCKKIRKGATVYLPVFVDGASLSMGDLHAKMGDGEVGVCGVEVDGKITVRVSVIKNWNLPTPFIVDNTHAMTVCSEENIEDALNGAVLMMYNFLMNELHMGDHEAEMLLSVTGDLSICQVVDPEKTARMEIPLSVTDAYGYKFK